MSAQDGRNRRVSAVDHDDGSAHILHVDMDAFFASVELLDHPELRSRPVVVAHDAPRAVVTTANYPARRYGVHSAMPVVQAKRLCPTAVLLPPRHHLYREYSAQVMSVLESFSPRLERVSVDEAWIDVSGAHGLFGSSGQIAQQIRRRLREELGLVGSVGVAPVKFAAKLASGMCKPDGLLIVNRTELQVFLDPLPVGALAGVGVQTQTALARYGIQTVFQLRHVPLDRLSRMVGQAAAQVLHARSRGRQSEGVVVSRPERSIGQETTLSTNLESSTEILDTIAGLAARPARALRAERLFARTVTLKLRDDGFQTITRSRTLPVPSSTTQILVQEAQELFRRSRWNRPTRLVGLRFSGLIPTEHAVSQDSLWGEETRWRAADEAADAIESRYGAESVMSAAALRARRSRSQ